MKQDLMHKDVNDVNITPEERRSIWQLWRQNLKDWAWYIRENPDWLDLDIQTAVKRHVIAPLREGWHRLRSLAHQKKRREFPESENRLAQLLLFAWGSMPRMGAGLRERFALRRRHNIRRSGSIRGLLERLHLHPAIFLGTCVTAAAVIVLLSVYTIGTTVRYDGINLGTVGSRRTVDQAVQQLETVTRQTLEDQDYAIDTALLSTQTHVVPRRDLESREEFAENLTDQIGDVTYGYTLYVDGEIRRTAGSRSITAGRSVPRTRYRSAAGADEGGLYHREHRGLQLCGKRGDQGGLCGQLPDLQPGLYR